MATPMIPVARKFTRKNRMTRIASTLLGRLVLERRHGRADVERLIEPNFDLHVGGTPRSLVMASRIASTTAMVLAPGCLSTRRKTPRFPFTRTISVWSAARSSTLATSTP